MKEQFTIIEKLGSGSFGVVYKAIDNLTNNVVAIKQIDLEHTEDDLADIQQEISLLAQCENCDYITKYFGSFVFGYKLWIVMEFMNGGSCLDLLKPGSFSENDIAIISKQLLKGLDYLHSEGKLHRDIKAANVLLNKEGVVKLADFGVSTEISNRLSKRNTFVGTPFWMAPEVIQQSGYNEKADIWSFGITLIEMFDGQPPYSSMHPMRALFLIPKNSPPRLQNSKSSIQFQHFVALCLNKDPKQRPSSKELLNHPFLTNTLEDKQVIKQLIMRYENWTLNNNEDETISSDFDTSVASTPMSEMSKQSMWDFTVRSRNNSNNNNNNLNNLRNSRNSSMTSFVVNASNYKDKNATFNRPRNPLLQKTPKMVESSPLVRNLNNSNNSNNNVTDNEINSVKFEDNNKRYLETIESKTSNMLEENKDHLIGYETGEAFIECFNEIIIQNKQSNNNLAKEELMCNIQMIQAGTNYLIKNEPNIIAEVFVKTFQHMNDNELLRHYFVDIVPSAFNNSNSKNSSSSSFEGNNGNNVLKNKNNELGNKLMNNISELDLNKKETKPQHKQQQINQTPPTGQGNPLLAYLYQKFKSKWTGNNN